MTSRLGVPRRESAPGVPTTSAVEAEPMKTVSAPTHTRKPARAKERSLRLTRPATLQVRPDPADHTGLKWAQTRRIRSSRKSRASSPPKQKPRLSGAFFKADDGTRTHDLLHGKCARPFAAVRGRSRAFAQTNVTLGFESPGGRIQVRFRYTSDQLCSGVNPACGRLFGGLRV